MSNKDKKGKKLKKKQKQTLTKIFLRSALITFIVFGALMGVAVGAWNTFIRVDAPIIPELGDLVGDKEESDEKEESINKNIAVFGVDEDGYRTDVIFVVNFSSQTNEVNIVSVPRDTQVFWSDEQKAALQALGKGSRSMSKINEMTSYGGIENIRNFTVNQLENMFGISIDNYVIINLDTFKDVVDAIGGVEMYVPQNMYYVDNYGGLYINLKEGQQVLDGDKAEQLIRFRSYPEGDVARVRTQQAFMEAFMDTVLSPSMILKIPNLVNVLFESVQTDISLFEIPQYYPYIESFNAENIEFHVLPGEGGYSNGVSYFFMDTDELDELSQVAFYNKPTQEELEALEQQQNAEEVEPVIDYSVSIQILNGSGISGAAGREKERLELEGYSVAEVGNYQDTNVQETIIIAKDKVYAEQFQKYYQNAVIEENQSMSYDIQIVIGAQQSN